MSLLIEYFIKPLAAAILNLNSFNLESSDEHKERNQDYIFTKKQKKSEKVGQYDHLKVHLYHQLSIISMHRKIFLESYFFFIYFWIGYIKKSVIIRQCEMWDSKLVLMILL